MILYLLSAINGLFNKNEAFYMLLHINSVLPDKSNRLFKFNI
jgi:hypothetical protein